MKVLPVHYYRRPHGRLEVIDCTKVNVEDLDYFLDNDIKVSMEELAGDIIVYGCPSNDESEESELIVFAQGRSCEETLSELAEQCKISFG